MTDSEANEALALRRRGWFAWGLLSATALGALLAFGRWEMRKELLPGLPQPRYGRLASERVDSERNTCTFDLVVEGLPAEIGPRYSAALATAGWQAIGSAGDRVNYQRGEQVARVAVRIPTATEPGWSRVRVNVGPCVSPAVDSQR